MKTPPLIGQFATACHEGDPVASGSIIVFFANGRHVYRTPGHSPRWGKEEGERHARRLIGQYSSRVFSLEEVAQEVRDNLRLSRLLLTSGLETQAYFQARIDIFRQWFAHELDWTGYNNYGEKEEQGTSGQPEGKQG
jgi:hypothetical protein